MRFAASLGILAFALSGFGEPSSTLCAEPEFPRLAGIMVGPEKREALFVDRKDAHAAFLVEVGDDIAGFKILSISPEQVVLAGPSGTAQLALEQDIGAVAWQAPAEVAPTPDLSTLRTEAAKSGASIGLLAMQRDQCARAGLLPGVAADSQDRLQRLIATISHLPGRDGPDAEHNAPTQLLATALSAGLDAAKQRVVFRGLDAADCAKVNAGWQADAGRYGLQ
jgi:hypothetical protein